MMAQNKVQDKLVRQMCKTNDGTKQMCNKEQYNTISLEIHNLLNLVITIITLLANV